MAALEVVADHRDLFDLGNHSWSHPDFRDLDDAAIRDQLERTEAAILAAVNVSTKPWFRPPYGGLDDQVPATVGAAGWGYDGALGHRHHRLAAGSRRRPDRRRHRRHGRRAREGGSIVLMHLGGFKHPGGPAGILDGLEAQGPRRSPSCRRCPRRARSPSELEPAGLDDPLQELAGPRLARVVEIAWSGGPALE